MVLFSLAPIVFCDETETSKYDFEYLGYGMYGGDVILNDMMTKVDSLMIAKAVSMFATDPIEIASATSIWAATHGDVFIIPDDAVGEWEDYDDYVGIRIDEGGGYGHWTYIAPFDGMEIMVDYDLVPNGPYPGGSRLTSPRGVVYDDVTTSWTIPYYYRTRVAFEAGYDKIMDDWSGVDYYGYTLGSPWGGSKFKGFIYDVGEVGIAILESVTPSEYYLPQFVVQNSRDTPPGGSSALRYPEVGSYANFLIKWGRLHLAENNSTSTPVISDASGFTGTNAGILWISNGSDGGTDNELYFTNESGTTSLTSGGSVVVPDPLSLSSIITTSLLYGTAAGQNFSATGGIDSATINTSGNATFGGNVGIGITPLNEIHINKSTDPSIRLTKTGLGSTASDGVVLGMWDTGGLQIWGYENGPFRIGTNGTEAFRLDASQNATFGGNVTIAKDTDAKVRVGYSASQSGDIWWDYSHADLYIDNLGNNDNYDIIFRTKVSGTPNIPLTLTGAGNATFGGNVKITKADYNALTLQQSAADATSKGAVMTGARRTIANAPFSGYSTWDNGSDRFLYLGGGNWGFPDATSIIFYTAAAYNETANQGIATLTLDGGGATFGGNVGITGTSPLLNITGSVNAFILLKDTGGSTDDKYCQLINDSDFTYLKSLTDAGAVEAVMQTWDHSTHASTFGGDVGIGIAPTIYDFDVYANEYGPRIREATTSAGVTYLKVITRELENDYMQGFIQASRDEPVLWNESSNTWWKDNSSAYNVWQAIGFSYYNGLEFYTGPAAAIEGQSHATFEANYKRMTIDNDSVDVFVKLTVTEGDSGLVTPSIYADTAVFEDDTNAGITIGTGLAGVAGAVYFATGDLDPNRGMVEYNHYDDLFTFYVNNVGNYLRVTPTYPAYGKIGGGNAIFDDYDTHSNAIGDPDSPFPRKEILDGEKWLTTLEGVQAYIDSHPADNKNHTWRLSLDYVEWERKQEAKAETRIVPVTSTIPAEVVEPEDAWEIADVTETVPVFEEIEIVIKVLNNDTSEVFETKVLESTPSIEGATTEPGDDLGLLTISEPTQLVKVPVMIPLDKPRYTELADGTIKIVTQEQKKELKVRQERRKKAGLQFDTATGKYTKPAQVIESGTKEITIKTKEEAEAEALTDIRLDRSVKRSPLAELCSDTFQVKNDAGKPVGVKFSQQVNSRIEALENQVADLLARVAKLEGR